MTRVTVAQTRETRRSTGGPPALCCAITTKHLRLSLEQTVRLHKNPSYANCVPSSMAFFTARSPSLMASLICVMVCWLGPFTSRVTERGFPHFSMKVYFSSPWFKRFKRINDSLITEDMFNHNSKTRTHQCVFVHQPSVSQTLGCEVVNGIHGNAATSQGESTKRTWVFFFFFGKLNFSQSCLLK